MRVLFTSVPGVGHLHPMLPIATAVRESGGDVLWATGASGCERLRLAGIDAVDAGIDEADGMGEFNRRYPEIRDLAPHEVPDFMFPRLFGALRAPAMLRDLSPIATRWAPDLVVCDAAELAGPIVAAELGVPNVTHAFGALLPAARVAAASDEVASLWRDHGLEARPYCGCYDHLYLDIYPPSLQPPGGAHLGKRQLLRPDGIATAGEPIPGWGPNTDHPLLYVTLGTVFTSDAVLSTVLDAISDLDVRIVVTVGPRGAPETLGAQPANVHVARYIAQQDLLPHCAGVISHAGSGTFLAALAAGLPQLCVPQAADQFLNAAAAETAGCGIAVHPAEFSGDTVRTAVQRLLTDGSLRDAAFGVGEEIAAMPAATDVVQTLTTLVV